MLAISQWPCRKTCVYYVSADEGISWSVNSQKLKSEIIVNLSSDDFIHSLTTPKKKFPGVAFYYMGDSTKILDFYK